MKYSFTILIVGFCATIASAQAPTKASSEQSTQMRTTVSEGQVSTSSSATTPTESEERVIPDGNGFKKAEKLDKLVVSKVEADAFRGRYSRFFLGDKIPEDLPSWDITTQTQEQYKAEVLVYLKKHQTLLKPEYHSDK